MILTSELIHNYLIITHILITLITILGGYFINIKYIPVYLLLLPFIFLDWNDIGYKCFITLLTNAVSNDNNNNKEFVPDLLKKVNINIDVKNYNINTMFAFFMLLSWLIGYIRLLNYYNITLFPNKYLIIFVMSVFIFWLLVIFKIKRNNIDLYLK